MFEWASQAKRTGLLPRAILSVFPSGQMDAIHNLHPLAGRTKVLILSGDADRVVGTVGVAELVAQLAASGFRTTTSGTGASGRTDSSSPPMVPCCRTIRRPGGRTGRAPTA